MDIVILYKNKEEFHDTVISLQYTKKEVFYS